MGFCGLSTNWKVGWLILKVSLGKLLNPQTAPQSISWSVRENVTKCCVNVWCDWVNEVLQLYKYQFICQCSDGKSLHVAQCVALTWHTLAHP